MSPYSHIGKAIRRVDGVEKVTGAAKYTVDIKPPGVLCGKLLRSPHPHARILHIETGKARKLLGVHGIITAEETKKISYSNWRRYPHLMDEYPLAPDKARFIGDEIAAVAAVDEDAAEEALSLIEVEYEILPAVFDPEEAMKEGAPQIHEGPTVKNTILGKMTLISIRFPTRQWSLTILWRPMIFKGDSRSGRVRRSPTTSRFSLLRRLG
jgi:4-hydroxybenzoyl-CoA reductase subunit alpha